uniref:Uncharacterized protein n=1 Tax=Tanacetum cinerariifolium TaxID=118510 RepID=A0A699XHH0_TANCI|nr:hypothetical protein [Tanacetum cinerariifolium]
MTKAAWLAVAVVIGEVGVALRAVVVGQLENAGNRLHPFIARGIVGRNLLTVYQRQKVQAELGVGEVALFHQAETKYPGVEVQ